MKIIGGKWKPVVLFCIENGIERFGAMHRAIPGITKQMLTQQLRELESDDVLVRTVFPEVPPRVEYALTSKGQSLLAVVEVMRNWGENDLANTSSS